MATTVGPALTSVLRDHIKNYDIRNLYFMDSAVMTVCGIEGCRVTRCGYTGEDGVEVRIILFILCHFCVSMLFRYQFLHLELLNSVNKCY